MAPIVEVITMLAARIATRTPMKRRNGPAFLTIQYPSKVTLRFCAQRTTYNARYTEAADFLKVNYILHFEL